MNKLATFFAVITIAMGFSHMASARYLQSDPIGVTRDYSDPQLQVLIKNGLLPVVRYNNHRLNHNYGYAFQNPIKYIDPNGLDVTVTINTNGARGAGHIGGSTNGQQSQGFYPVNDGKPFDQGILKPDLNQNASTTIPSTPDQDAKFDACMLGVQLNPGNYNVLTNNCNHTIKRCLRAAGIGGAGLSPFPNDTFCKLASKYGCKGDGCDECN